MAIKIRSTPSFGGEVMPEAPCPKILRRVKITCKYEQIFRNAEFASPFARSSCLLPDDSAVRIVRHLWWTNQEFLSCRYHSTMVLHAHILPGQWTIGPLVAAVQRRKLTPSTWSSWSSFIHLFNDAVSCLDYIIASNDRVIVAYWIRRDMKGNSRLAFPLGTGKNHKEPRVRIRWRNAKDSVETFCEDYSLLECIALMMEAVRSSETSVYFN
jgi:hypothetical protein